MALVNTSSPLSKTFSGMKFFITGNTGLKGSWLILSLELIGARVSRYSNSVKTNPLEFELFKEKFGKELTISTYKSVGSLVKGS